MFCRGITFLFITWGLNFSNACSPQNQGKSPVPMPEENALAFWNLQVPWVCSSAVFLCVKILCGSTEHAVPPPPKRLMWCLCFSMRSLWFTISEAWFLFLTTSRWFAVRLDAICAIFVTVVAFGSLILANSKYIQESLFVV